MESNTRIFYELDKKALDFPVVGMLKSLDKKTFIDIDRVPEGVVHIKELLESKSKEYEILDNTKYADHRIDLSNNDLGSSKTVFFFFNVFCKKETNCFFYIHTDLNIRIWHNESFFSISVPKTGNAQTIQLVRGNNRICFECQNPKSEYIMTFRLNSIENEERNGYLSVLQSTTNRCYPFFVYTESQIEDNILKLDCIAFSNVSKELKSIQVLFSSFPNNKLIATREIPIKKNQHFEFDLKNHNFTKSDYLKMVCSYKISHDDLYRQNINVPIYDLKRYRNVFSDAINKNYSLEAENSYIKCMLDYWNLFLSSFSANDYSLFKFFCEFQEDLLSIKENIQTKNYNIPRTRRIYFYSQLDGLPMSYLIRIPQNYNESKKYPLLAIFSIQKFDDYSSKYNNLTDVEEFLCADISGRGMTMGSYIGEASINEIIEHIISHFSIDEQRIYALGHSNGAYAAWIQAQAYPHRYAGVLSSAGIPMGEMLNNLSNHNVFSFTSTQDLVAIQEASKKLAERTVGFDSFKVLVADTHSHATLEYIYRNKLILQDLLSKPSEKYPHKIDYITCRNRWCQAYWLKIHSIECGCFWGKINAIGTEESLSIIASGITGFEITLPPWLNRSKFKIVVNNSEFLFLNEKSEKLNFRFSNQGKSVTLSIPPRAPTAIYKGDGLLNVYSGPMKIVLNKITSQTLQDFANAFSSPVTNCHNKNIYVKYPIVIEEDLSLSDFPDCNLIVFDCNTHGTLAEMIRNIAPIETTEQGYYYNQTNYFGEYCIMQIVSNPIFPQKCILYINANSISMYNKNFFARTAVLNSYTSGLHPFYNNAALIYDSDGYHSILDYGSQTKRITV